jgi:hypothetical protein
MEPKVSKRPSGELPGESSDYGTLSEANKAGGGLPPPFGMYQGNRLRDVGL